MRLRIATIAALGLALALYLVMYVGFGAVFSAAITVGWRGLAFLCLYALWVFLLLGAAWYVLLPDSFPGGLWIFVWARMVRDAAAEVLPFSQLGGIVLGARAAILHGVSAPLASASIIVDVTTEMLAQIGYIALGVALLSARAPRTSLTVPLTRVFVIGLVLAAVAGEGFLAVQRFGHRVSGKLTARLLPRAVTPPAAVVAQLKAIYRSPARVGLSSALHLAGWITSAIGAWIAFRLIGARVDLASALILPGKYLSSKPFSPNPSRL